MYNRNFPLNEEKRLQLLRNIIQEVPRWNKYVEEDATVVANEEDASRRRRRKQWYEEPSSSPLAEMVKALEIDWWYI